MTPAAHIRIQAEDFDAAAEVARLTEGRADVGAVVTLQVLVIVILTRKVGAGVTVSACAAPRVAPRAMMASLARTCLFMISLLSCGVPRKLGLEEGKIDEQKPGNQNQGFYEAANTKGL